MNDIKRAIEILNHVKTSVSVFRQEGSIDLAISALEKHIPRQPKWTQIYDTCTSPDDYEFICPTCEEVVEYEEWICYECHQTLDWSVEE